MFLLNHLEFFFPIYQPLGLTDENKLNLRENIEHKFNLVKNGLA